MPTYKYEALDTSGAEVKDSIEAANEEEASQKIKARGYFVTKLTATSTPGGAKGVNPGAAVLRFRSAAQRRVSSFRNRTQKRAVTRRWRQSIVSPATVAAILDARRVRVRRQIHGRVG